jgi:hypothetical protein
MTAIGVLQVLTRSRLARLLIARLPSSVAEVLREIGDAVGDDAESVQEVHSGAVGAGQSAGASSFLLGDVEEGAKVAAVNVVRGTLRGGTLRAVNLLLGDVHGGELHAVNVIVGDVHGGELRNVHLIVGNVYGGHFESCYAVIGDVCGGSGRIARVLGSVAGDGIEVGRTISADS